MKIKIVVPLILMLLIIQCNTDHSNDNVNHYQVKLKLDPASQYMNVKLNLKLNPVEPLPDTLVFSLHKEFTQLNVTGPGIQDFTFDKDAPSPSIFMPDARKLIVILDEKTRRDRPLTLSFEYEGSLTQWPDYSANVVTEEWVELGLYLPWFPSGYFVGLFTFDIEAECDPAYQLRSFGKHTMKNGKWYFQQMTPTFDIVLFASKGLKTMKQESGSNIVYVHYQGLHDTTAEKFANDLIGIFNLFDAWFGGNKEEECITLVESPRKMGGGYYRKGLVTMTGLSDEKYVTEHEYFIRYLAHETGHLWWHMASAEIWEDWMNEGFAEYSALLAVRELFGEASFNQRMDDKKKSLEGTPPIWGFDRSDMTTSGQSRAVEANLYSKGPVLLHQLSKRIGSDEFKGLCKEMVKSSTSSTDDFLKLLEKNHGSEVRNWFEGLLKSY